MRSISRRETEYRESDFLTIDERIQKAIPELPLSKGGLRYDRANNPITGLLDNQERPIDVRLLDNEAEINYILMKASGVSQHVTPSFYEGGDDVYIEAKTKTDVTVTEADRRAIHTISNYYNTLGIYRDDFDKTNNDKLARNAYYALCEKAMMDYMRSVQYTVKDKTNGDTIKSATEFFEAPNPQETMGDIFASLIRDLTRYDAGVIVKSFKKSGHCCEIKTYLATEFWKEQDRVPFIVNVPIMNTVDLTGGTYASHQQPTYQGWWSHGYTERFWQRSRTGVYIPFQPEEICYCMMYPRTDGIYGTDFIKFLKYQIQYLIDSTKAAGKTFENGVVPSVVWEHPEVHTVPQLKQRIAELKFNNQGWQRFGSVIHAVNGEKVSSLAQSLHDMQWLEGQKFVAQLVWATWGFSPEEFMGGGENRASSYVKRNITKSRLLYPLMTFLESRVNREILPYLKGYRKTWQFQFIRDIELDDEQKVATTNSIKAGTFLQYYGAGFPIEASMELSGLDKNQFKFDIDLLEAEILQNQMMMLGQQPGEQGAGGMEDQEQGRYGVGSEDYVDASIGEAKPGPESTRDPHDPSIEEQTTQKAKVVDDLPRVKSKDKLKEYLAGRRELPPVPDYQRSDIGKATREEIVEQNMAATKQAEEDQKESNKKLTTGFETAAKVAMALAKKKPAEKGTISKSTVISPLHIAGAVLGYAVGKHLKGQKEKEKEKPQSDYKARGETTSHVGKRVVLGEPGEKSKVEDVPKPKKKFTPPTNASEPGPDTGKRREVHRDLSGNKIPIVPKKTFNKSLTIDENDTRPDQDYDPVQLQNGIRVELEHTNDEDIAKEIAKDHLDEFKDYYIALKRMETSLRKAGLHYTDVKPYKLTDTIVKAKVYITHPSEAPKGRSVKRGNKGGYYYITTEQHRGRAGNGGAKEHPKSKKKNGGRGWETGGGGEPEAAPALPPEPPEIEGVEEQINIYGNGVGLAAGIISGRLVVKKLNNGPTNTFIKIVEKKSGENPDAEKIITIMVQTAQEMGLEISG